MPKFYITRNQLYCNQLNITESTVKRWFKEWEISVHGKMGNILTLDVRAMVILTEFSKTGFETDKH